MSKVMLQWPVLGTEVTLRAIVVKFDVPRPVFIVQRDNSEAPPMLEDSRSDLHGALSMHHPPAKKSEPTCDCERYRTDAATKISAEHSFLCFLTAVHMPHPI